MGTELQNMDCDISMPLWSARALIESPDTVRQIHIDNIDAGADIITTNTFRTQKRTIEKAKYNHEGLNYSESARELTKIAVDIAQDAVMLTNDEVLIAGCIAPLEDCYKPELVPDAETLDTEHYEHIKNLVDAEVDFLLAETMLSLKEINAVLSQAKKFEIEFAISLLCKNENELFSGESLKETVSLIEKYSPSALLINCIHPSKAESIIISLRQMTRLPLGVYCNIGNPDYTEGSPLEKTVSEDEYVVFANHWKELGVRIIGGCCGTTPEYIKRLSALKV